MRGSDSSLQKWSARSHAGYAPRRVCLAIPATTKPLPGLLQQRLLQANGVAWVCSGHSCQPPVTDIEAFQAVLDETTVSRKI